MTIAFEINFHPNKDNSIQHFLLNLFSFYSEKYPHINFILISNYKESNQNSTLPNQQFIIYSSGIGGKVKAFFVQEFLLGFLLKKKKVNILICDGYYKRKNKLNIKTFSWLNDLSAIKKIVDLSDAQQIFCINDFIKNKVLVSHSKDESFIHLSNYTSIENINPTTFDQKEKIKQNCSNGNEYFLFYADQTTKQEEYVSVMKAFSLFKKWQKSNMKLIMILDYSIENEILKLIENYKFREDLKLFLNDDSSKSLNLLSACYGCIMSMNSSIQIKMIHAIKLNISMIIDETDFNKSSFANACVYSKMDEVHISQKMILLYKDEDFRDQIINGTRVLSENFNWHKISDKIWQTISKLDKN